MFIGLDSANGAGGFQAVHDRHLNIHQDQVIGIEVNLVYRDLAVLSAINTHADACEKL